MSSTYLIPPDRWPRTIQKNCQRPRPPPHHLPPELTDRIIDFCHNDKATLSNCALTHSSWLATSRLHLFHTISTTGVHERTSRGYQLMSIVGKRWLTHPHERSPVIPYIKEVKIDTFVDPGGATSLLDAMYLACEIRALCRRVRLEVPSLHVALRRSPNRMYAPPLWSFEEANDMVTRIKLSDVKFDHPNEIWSLLSLLPRLQHLELERIGFDTEDFGTPAERTFGVIPLLTMRMTTAFMRPVIDSLIKVAGSLPRLKDFGIAYQDTRHELAMLPQLADAIQTRVKCLRFTADCFPGCGFSGDGWRPSALDRGIPEFVGRFLSLTTLVLDNLRLDRDPSKVSFEWITGVLQQLSSPVQKLVFEVIMTECSQLDVVPWPSIDAIIRPEMPQFRALTRVEVLVRRGVIPEDRPPIYKDVVCSEIALRLPNLNLQGLLWCDTVGC